MSGCWCFYDIHQGEKILIGRDSRDCQLVFNDPVVSNWHLLIYSVIYDLDDPSGVNPLVYAEDRSSNGTYWNGALIGKGNGGMLLSHADELRISPRITLYFQTNLQYETSDMDLVQQLEVKVGITPFIPARGTQMQQYFRHRYEVTPRKLGIGAHGHVYMAIDIRTGRQLACKVINLRSVREKEMERVRIGTLPAKTSKEAFERRIEELTACVLREVEIMKDLSHVRMSTNLTLDSCLTEIQPNVVHLEKVFQTVNTLYVFEELITGGDLFSYIEHKGGRLNEAETAVILRQILEALEHLHSLDIVHRDLKPENILMASLDDAARISDVRRELPHDMEVSGKGWKQWLALGSTSHRRLSRCDDFHVRFLTACIREVQGHNRLVKVKGYTKAVDMWSLGCIAVAMLIGSAPFDILCNTKGPKSASDTLHSALPSYSLDGLYSSPDWISLNDKAKDFVKRLLVLDEQTRMTAQEALDHEMFTDKYDKRSFGLAYQKAIRGWKPQKPPVDIVEKIFPSIELKARLNNPCLPRKPRLKALRPIEPHYQPRHKNVDLLISPLRSRNALPAIREVTEDAQALVSTATGFQSRDTRRNLSPPNNFELPALETLSLTEEGRELGPIAHESFLGRASREDLLAEKTSWTTQSVLDAIHEDGICSEPRGIESTNALVLRENMSKCNYSLQSNNFDSQDEPSQASNLMSMGLSEWLLPVNLDTCRTTYDFDEKRVPQTRKRLRMYDIDLDENLEPENYTVSSQTQNDTFSTSFTPINRRKSMKLDDGQSEEMAPRLSYSQRSTNPGFGHDGPLISKRASRFGPHGVALLGSVHPADGLGSKDELTLPQPGIRHSHSAGGRTKERMNSSLYDYEEASIYAEAGMESRHFRTARSYDEAVSRKKAGKVIQGQRSELVGDPTDCTSTTH
ncbi:MAG: hypothetical protein Q9187_003626 [Circinaria calcarea]